MKIEFRTLEPDEIEIRVSKVQGNGVSLLLYKNARVDMAILDETVGCERWQRDHKEVKGNLYCGIGIFTTYVNEIGNITEQWIWKWDCGVESAFGDKEKGEASDSFKRAGFNWGIGRELYTSPFIFVESENTYDENKKVYKLSQEEQKRSQRMRVKEIEYNDKGEISKLVIVDNKGIQVFPKIEDGIKDTPQQELKCENCGEAVRGNVACYSVSKFKKVLCYDCQKLQAK